MSSLHCLSTLIHPRSFYSGCFIFSYMKANAVRAAFGLLVLLTCATPRIYSQTKEPQPRAVNMTLVRRASRTGAYCLDGSLPAYHLERGFGAGARNWLLQFEGGGWCNDVRSCRARAATRRGSTRHMSRVEYFDGILSNNASWNQDFYNWNRVKLRYCDGASFAGDAKVQDGESLLYFRGQRIWNEIILDLLPKGLAQAEKALLSGCSAGGLSTFLHCDDFTSYLPKNATVKCLSDAGFFLDARDVSQNHTMRYFFKGVVSLQGVVKNLNENCTNSPYPELCFFPQYALPYIRTPFFILNTAYDIFQFRHIFVPPAADPDGNWYHCKLDPAECDRDQMNALQGFRKYMLESLQPFINSTTGGMFMNSCFAHCQSELQQTWYAPDSPRVNNKTIAEAVGDWYFGRRVSKEIDCAYPCNRSCYNQLS